MKNKLLLSCLITLYLFFISSIQVSADGVGQLVELTDDQQEILSLLHLRQTNFYSIDYENENSSYIIRWEKLQEDGSWQAMELVNEVYDGGKLLLSANLEDFIRVGILTEDGELNTYEFLSSSLPNRIERDNRMEALLGNWEDDIEITANKREPLAFFILRDSDHSYSLNIEEISSDYEKPGFEVEGIKDVFALTIEFIDGE
ncbi:MAG: hypothetical protein ACTHYF_00020 [Ruoffia tabacinasalis]|uniref:Uncharacterized protein n=1 Tax=Ruoffia tabacinasalis TaxID=87458 RepID=A0ABS0LM35_9LACT|nr:hypothetical protein [Ruoffia tabacinasalis]MBG9979313.1 hypothetical protein [Ruoffia tabacinasalis]